MERLTILSVYIAMKVWEIMRVLSIQEVEQVDGGLSPAGNVGLGLALVGFGTVVVATMVAPMGVIAGGMAIIGAGIAALSGAATALPTPPSNSLSNDTPQSKSGTITGPSGGIGAKSGSGGMSVGGGVGGGISEANLYMVKEFSMFE
jgi:hypothetical protein